MRKTTLLLLFLSSFAGAVPNPTGKYLDIIGPATSASNVNISSTTTNIRNCLTYLAVSPTVAGQQTNATITIYAATTAIFNVVQSSGGVFLKNWDVRDPICAQQNGSMTIGVTGPSGFNINYQGYTF